jgi:hypothetical protein
VTTAVINGTFLSARISVGGSRTIKCTITVASNAGLGVAFNRLITITSNNDSAAKDAVKMTVQRT